MALGGRGGKKKPGKSTLGMRLHWQTQSHSLCVKSQKISQDTWHKTENSNWWGPVRVKFQQVKWPWNSNTSLDEMETNRMVQLNSPFCTEKKKQTTEPATTFHFYHPLVKKCPEEMYLTRTSKIFHDSPTKKVMFIKQSYGSFLPFSARPWISSSVTNLCSIIWWELACR